MSYMETKELRNTPLYFEQGNADSVLNELHVVKYDDGKVGFVAQQVHQVWPQGVIFDQQRKKAVNIDYIALLGLAVRNIQELNEKILRLEMELVMQKQ